MNLHMDESRMHISSTRSPEQAVCNQCGDLSMSEGISLYVAMTDVSGYNDSKPKLYTV